MATKTAAGPSDTDIAESFNTTDVTHKGKTFSFRELSAEEYDQCVELASKGEGDDKSLDTVQLLRWMIVRGSVDPKLDPASLGKLPFSATTKISKAVNDLHFLPDEDEAPLKTCVNTDCDEAELRADAKFCVKCGKEQPAETDAEGNEVRPNS
jgi:hypothetical protein